MFWWIFLSYLCTVLFFGFVPFKYYIHLYTIIKSNLCTEMSKLIHSANPAQQMPVIILNLIHWYCSLICIKMHLDTYAWTNWHKGRNVNYSLNEFEHIKFSDRWSCITTTMYTQRRVIAEGVYRAICTLTEMPLNYYAWILQKHKRVWHS